MEEDKNRITPDPNENTGNLGSDRNNKKDKDRDIDNPTEAPSRTFNQDDESWKEENNETSNQGTKNNDWDAKNQMERSVSENGENNTSTHGRFNDEEQNKYSPENDRRNREELE